MGEYVLRSIKNVLSHLENIQVRNANVKVAKAFSSTRSLD